MLKAILFDFDGVLVESVDIKTKAFAKLFEKEGPEIVEKVVDYHLANGGVSRYKKFEHIYNQFLGIKLNAEVKKDLGIKFSNLVIQNVIEAPWVEGAEYFLKNYYHKMDLYVVSGTPEDELKDIVYKKGIKKYFKETYGSPETKGNLIKRIISDGNYTKDQVVFVGDAITDLKGAFEADVPFIGRVSEKNNNPFDGYGIPIVSNLKDLQRIVDRYV